jgi:hypothetical protein
MIAVRGRIQREGEVVHLVAHRLIDLSAELATVAAATRPSRCRMVAATKSHAPAEALIRASYRPRGGYTRNLCSRFASRHDQGKKQELSLKEDASFASW